MAGQQQGRRWLLQAVDRGEGGGAAVGEAAADQRGAGVDGQAVVGDQGVAGEQQTAICEQVGVAARGVAGEDDRLWAAGTVSRCWSPRNVRTPATGGAVNPPLWARCGQVRTAAGRRSR